MGSDSGSFFCEHTRTFVQIKKKIICSKLGMYIPLVSHQNATCKTKDIKVIFTKIISVNFPISDELVHEKEKFKAISDEHDQTFAEMSGY